jgi:hypothetical protein
MLIQVKKLEGTTVPQKSKADERRERREKQV